MEDLAETMTDALVVELSDRISTEKELTKLGIKVLNLPEYRIKSALTNNPRCIQSAAHDVLSLWLKQQSNRQVAYTKLQKAMAPSKMDNLTDALEQWIEITGTHPIMTRARLEKIQKWIKQSIKEEPFSTIQSKIWTETPSNIPLEKIYTRLSWLKKSRKGQTWNKEELSDTTELLNEQQLKQQGLEEKGPVRIGVKGPGGIGKTTAAKHMALNWADSTSEELKKFDFVFYIALKDVKSKQTMEEIIIDQHSHLCGNNVQPAEIKTIIQGHQNQTILFILDGHDEYERGTSRDIDKAITKYYLRNCWIIMTSRETKELRRIADFLDAEAEITGFDTDRVKEYITKYVGSDEKCDELFNIAKDRGIITDGSEATSHKDDYGILSIPFLLNMVCVLFMSNVSLPKTKTGIIAAIVERCPNWEEIRKTGQKSFSDVESTIARLGKYVLKRLQDEDFHQMFSKEEIVKNVGREAFELGLFMVEETDPTEEEAHVFYFRHFLLLEFVAAKYVATLTASKLRELFPNWESIRKHQEVIRFACGITAEKQSILDFVYNTLQNFFIYIEDDDKGFLESLCDEVSDVMTIDPEHNNYFYCIDDNFDTTHFTPSRFYAIALEKASIEPTQIKLAMLGKSCPPAECTIVGGFEEFSLCNGLKVLKEMKKYQTITTSSFIMNEIDTRGYDSDEDTSDSDSFRPFRNIVKAIKDWKINDAGRLIIDGLTIDKKIKSLAISDSHLSSAVFNHIAAELNGCDKLRDLLISSTEGITAKLGGSISSMKALQNVDLSGCRMTSSVSCAVLKGLSHCSQLVAVGLDENILTNNLTYMFDAAHHPVFPLLEGISMDETNVTGSDMKSLLAALGDGKLPQLENFSYSSESDIDWTDTLAEMLRAVHHPVYSSVSPIDPGEPHIIYEFIEKYLEETRPSREDINTILKAAQNDELKQLETLDLSNERNESVFNILRLAVLTRDNIRRLSEVVASGQLPELTDLKLSHNKLINSITDLLEAPFPRLTNLQMDHTSLSKYDIRSLAEAFLTGKLPNLQSLDLCGNSLGWSESEYENLITAVKSTNREISLDLSNTNVSEELGEKLKSLCTGTNVTLTIGNEETESVFDSARKFFDELFDD